MVMKATGALPTEERVRKMNNYQWLWYYLNLVQTKKDENEERDNIIDYVTFFINGEMAKKVQEQKKAVKSQGKYEETNVGYENEVYNDSFEQEIQAALNGQNFIELPSSDYKSSTESKDDFIARALQIEQLAQENPDDIRFKKIDVPTRGKRKLTEEEILKMNKDNDLDIFVTDD